jgi:hypothetical protein
MPATYESIATTTLGSDTSGLIFNNISSAYTDLVIVFTGGITNNFWSLVGRFNNDSSSLYSSQSMAGNSSGGKNGTNRVNESWAIFGGYENGWPSNNLNCISLIHIMNYASTNMFKTVLVREGRGNNTVGAGVCVYRSTNAISSIYLYSSGGGGSTTNLYAGSTISLYGIKAA